MSANALAQPMSMRIVTLHASGTPRFPAPPRAVGRIRFLIRVLAERLNRQARTCPYCGSPSSGLIGKKKMVLELRRCNRCQLMYRWPKDTPRLNHRFYQQQYRQGITTDMPGGEALEKLKTSMFRGTEKDLSDKISILKTLLPQGRVLDYGCSWGYGTFQLAAAGYDVFGFEISQPRAEFGRRHMGSTIISTEASPDELAGWFDAVFASHVLEHIPTPWAIFDRIASVLKPSRAVCC